MALIATPWRVTLGATVLLDWNDLVKEDPRLKPRRAAQTVQPIRGANLVYIPRQLVGYNVTFTRIVVCASCPAAQSQKAASALALDALTTAQTLTIYLAGSGTLWSIAGAVIPENGYEAWCDQNKFYAQYQINGQGLTTGVLPNNALNPAQGAGWPMQPSDFPSFLPISDEGGHPITDESGQTIDQ